MVKQTGTHFRWLETNLKEFSTSHARDVMTLYRHHNTHWYSRCRADDSHYRLILTLKSSPHSINVLTSASSRAVYRNISTYISGIKVEQN
eukprot:scaffold14248_cov115-Skeletonema_marinoi.AAC.2